MIRPGIRDLAWLVVGASGLLVVVALVMQFQGGESPAAQVPSRERRIALVERMHLGLAAASEAEKSAVMAVTDEDSRAFADQARAAAARVEQTSQELEALLVTGGNRTEKELLREFSQHFGEFKRIDSELLDLTVKNTNLKASRLAFGPSAALLEELDAALTRVMNASGAAGNLKVIRLADDARIAALRIQALLPPHIAEESDPAMDEMERQMTRHDQVVHESLAELAAMPALHGNSDLEAARSAYARFSETRAQVLELSRENTNVRSLAISLHQKRKAALVCQDALDALGNAMEAELVPHVPVNPR